MEDRLARARLMSVLVLGVVALLVWLVQVPGVVAEPASRQLSVSFLDVGQGDAIFINTPEHVQILIDGGRDSAVLRELATVMPVADRSIDMVIGTHPDSDHIGGLIDVLKRYDVSAILHTDNEGDTPTADLYSELSQKEGASLIEARRGQIFSLGASTTLEVLWPEGSVRSMESNASSIIIKLTYGETSFLFTGDAPKRIEEYLVLAYGEHLESTVLKAGHHGSRTSTSELFLAEVAPEYAVLSYGQNNSYGHPHVEVTDILFNAGVEMLRTAEAGTITFHSDGKELWVE